jgi:hypothetical protein
MKGRKERSEWKEKWKLWKVEGEKRICGRCAAVVGENTYGPLIHFICKPYVQTKPCASSASRVAHLLFASIVALFLRCLLAVLPSEICRLPFVC